jgi:glycosyltransferase involved in cell wall biosynthesis
MAKLITAEGAAITGPNVACIFPSAPGRGGLGRLSADVLQGLAEGGHVVHAVGPAAAPGTEFGAAVQWSPEPPRLPEWVSRWTPLRWRRGDFTMLAHRRLGAWAAREVRRSAPAAVYAFAEVALETMRWAAPRGIPTILDNPTGDVRHFRAAAAREHMRWASGAFVDHPSPAMVRRSVEEYELAHRIRVASRFSKASMVEHGVPAEKIDVVPYPIDVTRFVPPESRPAPRGTLRVCSVAAITFAKGFQYLLEAARAVGPSQVHVDLVGGTTSRPARAALARLRAGLDVVAAPAANLVEAYHRAELFVLPTLHDGYGFVVAEAMACGLPVVVSDTCGARDLVEEGVTGWIVPAGETAPLVDVLRSALGDRERLQVMGATAREAVVGRARRNEGALAAWLDTVMHTSVPTFQGGGGAGDAIVVR